MIVKTDGTFAALLQTDAVQGEVVTLEDQAIVYIDTAQLCYWHLGIISTFSPS